MNATKTRNGCSIARCGIITTKYLAPTNSRGARVKAISGGGETLTVAWDYGLDEFENHANAASMLQLKRMPSLTADRVSLRGGCSMSDGVYAFAVSIQY